MYNDRVPYSLADKLKQAGFNKAVSAYWYRGGDTLLTRMLPLNYNATKSTSAPTFAEVFDWFMMKGFYVSVRATGFEGAKAVRFRGCAIDADRCESCITADWNRVAEQTIGIAIEWLKDIKEQ